MYQDIEPSNNLWKNSIKNNETEKHSHSDGNSELSGEERQQQSLSSICAIHGSHFVDNKANRSGGVVYLFGTSIDLFVKNCNFTENKAKAYYSGGVMYSENVTGSVAIQQCLFLNNSADSLSLVGTHSQMDDCEFLGYGSFTLAFQYATSSINNCTFNEHVITSIDAYGSRITITTSRCYGYKAYCLNWGNSEITIVGSQFAADAKVFLFTINWSNLTVIDSSFTNGHLVFQSHVGTDLVKFINCSFDTLSGFKLIGKSLFKNCTISNLREQFIWAIHSRQLNNPAMEDPTGSAQLEIVDCTIRGNRVSDGQPFIDVGNVSFTMINCLYTGNDVKNHLLLNGTTDVTISNVTFFNNSLGDNDDPGTEKSLLTINNTVMETNHCHFESNNLQHGSLLFVVLVKVMTVMNTIMINNYNNKSKITDRKMISIHETTTVEFLSCKFINNTEMDTLAMWSSNLFIIDNCSLENNVGEEFHIWNVYDVILQRSTFYKPDVGASSYLYDVNNLRIYSCSFTYFRQVYFDYGRNVKTKLFLLESVFYLKSWSGEIITKWSSSEDVSVSYDFEDFTFLMRESPYASGRFQTIVFC